MLNLPFMNRKWIDSMMKARLKRALDNKLQFDQIKPSRVNGNDVGIIASSFKPHNPLDEFFPDVDGNGVLSPLGNLRYIKMRLPVEMGLPIASCSDLFHDPVRAFFDEEIDIAALHFKADLDPSGWKVVMSLTPIELWTLRSGIRAATEHVVLGGLGMGWMLSQIAAKPRVKSIVVVENNLELLDWFGTRLCKKVEKVVEVIHDDIFEVAKKFDFSATRFVIDIWSSLGSASCDGRLKKLRRDGARVWAWGSPRGVRDVNWSTVIQTETR